MVANFNSWISFSDNPWDSAILIKSSWVSPLEEALLKTKSICEEFNSKKFISEFPGRSFKIKEVLNPNKKSLTKLPKKANLACRNYPDKVDVLKKKLKLKN